jgi:hypothetical protein
VLKTKRSWSSFTIELSKYGAIATLTETTDIAFGTRLQVRVRIAELLESIMLNSNFTSEQEVQLNAANQLE